jgi:predicted DNA-binding protein
MSKASKNNMSIAIDPEIQERMKVYATKKNISVSKLLRDLFEKYVPNTEEDFDTVILRVPHNAKQTEAQLRDWLNKRTESLVKALALDIAK